MQPSGPYEPPTPAGTYEPSLFVSVLSRITNPLLFLGGTLGFLGLMVVGLIGVVLAVQPSVFGPDPVTALIAAQGGQGIGWILVALGVLFETVGLAASQRR